MKLKQVNYWGFDIEAVKKRFEGNLTFINSFTVKGEYQPVAVFHSKNPNRDKGHKDYMLLLIQKDPVLMRDQIIVRGMDYEEMALYRYQSAIQCGDCQEIIHSTMRHDNASCGCGKVSIDGGRDYTRLGWKANAKVYQGIANLLTGEFTTTENH